MLTLSALYFLSNFGGVRMEYISLDIETTGLSAKTDSILEVAGWHIIDSVPVRSFSELIQPPVYIPRFIQDKTGITNSMVSTARPVEDVLPEFIQFCGNLPIIGYNVCFDYTMLCEKAKYLGYDFTLGGKRYGFDVYKVIKKYFKNLPSKKLEDVASFMNISQVPMPNMGSRGFHSALYDSFVTKLVLDACLNCGCKCSFDLLERKDNKQYGGFINEEVLPFE